MNADNSRINSLTLDDSSNDAVLASAMNVDLGKGFTKGDIGKDGWFSNKASNKYRQLLRDRTYALNSVS